MAGGVAGFLVAANKAHRQPLTQSSPPYKPGPDSTTLPVIPSSPVAHLDAISRFSPLFCFVINQFLFPLFFADSTVCFASPRFRFPSSVLVLGFYCQPAPCLHSLPALLSCANKLFVNTRLTQCLLWGPVKEQTVTLTPETHRRQKRCEAPRKAVRLLSAPMLIYRAVHTGSEPPGSADIQHCCWSATSFLVFLILV